METKETPNVLSDLIQNVPPVGELLEHTLRGIDDVSLAAEEERLRERILYLAGKLVMINQIRGVK